MLKKYISELIIGGCDEAGRGCLAGPVVAACVIFPKKFNHELINDSKSLSQSKREKVKEIIEKEAIDYAVGLVNETKIDSVNILNASFLAMHKAIDLLKIKPELLLIDGNRFNQYQSIKHKCIVKGDKKYVSIAAASILAKTYRDKIMKEIDEEFPDYKWKKNKGYPTKEHRNAIKKHGITKYHRKSFQLLSPQLFLDI